MSPRVAFFGGSFDPPHRGHLEVARAARAALALDTVLFAPVAAQPLKPGGATASYDDRVAMARLAIAGEPGFEVSLIDAPDASGAPNYTLETLEKLRMKLAPNCALFCLIGADSLAGLRHWYRAAEIPFVAPLIVASRPGVSCEQLRRLMPAGLVLDELAGADECARRSPVPVKIYSLRNHVGQQTRLYLLPGVNVDISATQIRELVHNRSGWKAGGQTVVPETVAEYIQEHNLYR